MKDKLPKDWEFKTLGEISDVSIGKTPPRENLKYFQGDKVWLSIRDLKNFQVDDSNEKLTLEAIDKFNINVVKKGTLLMSFKLTLGKLAFANCDLYTNEAIAALPIKKDFLEKMDEKYLFYSLHFIDLEVEVDNAVKGKTLNKQKLKNLKIPFPHISEQKKIVSVLDKTFEKLDQAIALVEENIRKLKQLNESILDEVFRNSDKFVRFLDYVSVSRKTITPEHEKKYNIIGLENIESNSGKLLSFKPIKGSESVSSKVVFKKGNILYGKLRPYLNKVYLAEFDGIATTEIIPFTVDKNMFDEKYILYFLRSPFFLEKVNLSCSGARMPRVTTEFWKTLLIPFLTISEQQRIVKYLDQTTEKNQKLTQHYQNKLEALKRLKNSVLDSAFKGELRRAKVIPITQPVIDPYFARTKKFNAKKKADKQAMVIALAIEAHEKVGKSLYRTKGEKTVEVLEKHLNMDFGREAEKMTAGPADFKHLVNVVEPLANEKKWFYTQEIKGENYDSHKYIKAENFDPFMMRCVQDLKPNLEEIRRVVSLFADMKTTRIAEVVATTYTGWNNLIIRNGKIDNEAIVTEARENWHEAKLKIDRQEFFDAIEWLKNNNLIPQGNGKEVK